MIEKLARLFNELSVTVGILSGEKDTILRVVGGVCVDTPVSLVAYEASLLASQMAVLRSTEAGEAVVA